MRWVIRRRGTLRFSGRVARPRSFDDWAETDGSEAVAAVASKRWFSVFGKRRAAKNEIWRELRQMTESGFLVGEVGRAVAEYGERMGSVALERSSLPRVSIDLRRLFVIPRAPYNALLLDVLISRLQRRSETAALKGGPTLIPYFCYELVEAIDHAIVATPPTLRRPVEAGSEWSIISVNTQVVWSVPLRPGPDWRGHYFLYEATPDRLTRPRRKELAATIKDLDRAVSEFSRVRKSAILASR